MLNHILVIFIILICSTNLIVYGEVTEDGKLFADALQLMKEKDFQSSLIKIRQFLSINPNNFEAKTTECAILLELKQVSEAETCLEINLTKKPDDLTNLLNLGTLYVLQENYNAAKIQFSLVHQRDPNDETAYANLLASRLLTGDDVEQIINEHKEILEKNEFNVQVLANLGKILNDKREFEKAKYFLDRAYEIDKKHVNVLEQLGVWYALQGDFQNADKYFQDALKEAPSNVSVLNNLGLLYRDRGDKFNDLSMYYKSIEYYQSVLLLDSENVYANLGIDYSSQKIQDISHGFYFTIYLYSIAVFAIGIFITWIYTRDTKKLEKVLKIETDIKKIEKVRKKIIKLKVIRIFLIGLLSIAASIVVLNQTLKIPLNDGLDMTNWTATVIEIGIGVMIAIIILVYELSKQDQFTEEQKVIEKQQREISQLVIDVKNISENQHKLIQTENSRYDKRRNFIRRKISKILNICNTWLPSEEELKLFETDKSKIFLLMSSDTKEHILRIECNPVRLIEIVLKLLQELEPVINSGFESLDTDEFEKLEDLINFGNEQTDELDSQKLVIPLTYPDFRNFFIQIHSIFRDMNVPTYTIKVMPNGFTKDF